MLFKLIDIESEFNAQEQDTILVRKGNQVHVLLLLLSAFYGFVYAIVNWVQGFYFQTIILSSGGLLSIFCILLYRKGFLLTSKIFNLIQLVSVITLMFYFSSGIASHERDSILVFFIPVSLGTLIVFQGRERKYGYFLASLMFVLMVVLMVVDQHYQTFGKEVYQEGVSTELILNLTGATLAAFFEMFFILILSNKIDEKLLKTNKELDSFVYSVSHDLRSPLLSVRGLLQLSMDESKGDAILQKYLQMANKSIDHLDEIIREILAYSRNSRVEVTHELFDVEKMIDQISQDLKYAVEDPITFEKEIQGSPMLTSDKARINTVLRNLIGNSVKYRKKGAEVSYIKTKVRWEGNQMIIEVEDNGEGISPDHLSRIFDMFFRGSATGQGTGLGLYITREILFKLHGKIDVKSAVGIGTTMIVTIPDSQKRA